MLKTPNKYRIKTGPLGSANKAGCNGAFLIPSTGGEFAVIVSDKMDWEHVSVSLQDRCPTWEEMCLIKDMFWDKEDCVIQFHPPESQYVNCHPNCLHLWRKVGSEFETPPIIMISPK